MPSQALQAFREELLAHLNVKDPTLDEILEGLHELDRHEMSQEAHHVVQAQIVAHNQRVSLLNEGIEYLSRLEADKYPDKPGTEITFPMKTELTREVHVESAALGSFNVTTPATSLGMRVDSSEDKRI